MATITTTEPTPLRARMKMREEEFRSTGYYQTDLEAKNADPIRFEVLFTRLQQLVTNAREVGALISASPSTREQGEIIFGLYTPEGDAICLSTGLMISGSIAVVVLAYTVRFLAVSLSSLEAGFERLSPNLDAVARTLGETAMSALWSQNGAELAACGLVRSRSWSMNWPHIQM